LSAQKAKKFDPDSREQKQSVVQRFITPEVVPEAASPALQKQESAPPSAVPAPSIPVIPAETEPEEKYLLFNAMEETVKEEVRATMNKASICKCEKCYHAVCAVVLNSFMPQYSTSREDILINKAKVLLNVNALTELSNGIFSAMEQVKSRKEQIHG
jgi:hypothetical protein